MTDSPTDPKSALRDAATALFARHGYEAVSVTRIAAAVGATKGLYYHHYAAKADILADIAAAAAESVLAAAEAALAEMPEDAPADRRLEALAQAELTEAFRTPDAARIAAKYLDLLIEARLSPEHVPARDRAVAARQALDRLYHDAYQAGVRDGRLEPLAPRFAVWLIRLPILSATDWSVGPDAGRIPEDRVAEAVARFAAKGLLEAEEPA